jgi:hypothetical protein
MMFGYSCVQGHLARGQLLPSVTLQYSSEGVMPPGGSWLAGGDDDTDTAVAPEGVTALVPTSGTDF